MSSFSRISKRFIEEEDEASLDKLKHHSLNISKIFISPLLAFIVSPSVLIFTKLF